jgi:hypothetical protein
MILISIRADIKKLSASLDDFAKRQIPFATAQALNGIAKRAVAAEQQAMQKQLDRPTSFTLKGVSYLPATKARLVATVYIKDIQTAYLTPEIVGGNQVLGKGRGILKPVDQLVNQYGNLPRGLIARLRGRPDIFVGKVETKAGEITGVWQRVNITKSGRQRKHTVRGNLYSQQHGALKLLIRIGDPAQVKVRYKWSDAVKATVTSPVINAEWNAALSRALATAK